MKNTLRQALINANVKRTTTGSISTLGAVLGQEGAPTVAIVFNPWYIYEPDAQSKVRELVGGDFYILPSSTQEVLCVGKANADADDLLTMVKEINRGLVEGQGVYLADDVYEIKGKSIVSAVK